MRVPKCTVRRPMTASQRTRRLPPQPRAFAVRTNSAEWGQCAAAHRDRLTAMATKKEYGISIVPNPPQAVSPTHDGAVSDGRSEADAMGVDDWLTEDHTHVVKLASHRPPDN